VAWAIPVAWSIAAWQRLSTGCGTWGERLGQANV
jgi:hypothetical protein